MKWPAWAGLALTAVYLVQGDMTAATFFLVGTFFAAWLGRYR